MYEYLLFSQLLTSFNKSSAYIYLLLLFTLFYNPTFMAFVNRTLHYTIDILMLKKFRLLGGRNTVTLFGSIDDMHAVCVQTLRSLYKIRQEQQYDLHQAHPSVDRGEPWCETASR